MRAVLLLLALVALTGAACSASGSVQLRSASGNDQLILLDYGEAAEHEPALAEMMLDLMNGERAEYDLPPLLADEALTELAVEYALEMAGEGFFAHRTPDGRDPFDRMSSFYIRYTYAGENLALAPTVESAHRELMNSSGHRANILNPNYERAGIAVVKTERGYLVVQEFTDAREG